MKHRKSGVPAINELVPYRAVPYEQTDTTNRLISVPSRDIRVLLFYFGAGSRDRVFLGKWDGCKHRFLASGKKSSARISLDLGPRMSTRVFIFFRNAHTNGTNTLIISVPTEVSTAISTRANESKGRLP